MKKMSTRMIVEAGLMIAIAQVLSYVTVFELPQGGSITAGSMVPILIFAIRWGVGPGLLAGTVYGILQFILGPKYSFHIISILFDYVVAFGCLGFAVMFGKSIVGAFMGTVVGVLGRFVCHVISGAIVFASYAPEGTNPWIYSMVYNGSYLSLELVISVVIIGLLYKPLIRNLNNQ